MYLLPNNQGEVCQWIPGKPFMHKYWSICQGMNLTNASRNTMVIAGSENFPVMISSSVLLLPRLHTGKAWEILRHVWTLIKNRRRYLHARWQVELFFRWIKQHLRIKTFYGTSPNAVKTQIWIAISTYLLVAIMKKRLDLPGSLHTILQILEVNIFDKRSFIQIVKDAHKQESEPAPCNQLNLFNS